MTALSPLALEKNLALLAGAGTGKTHCLVSACLHLLGGATRREEPLSCAQLWAVTFTDKTAAEMKERLRRALADLARGAVPEELLQSYGAVGKSPPGGDFWAGVLAELPSANVGTFHALCAQILRRYAAEARIDPGFALLELRAQQQTGLLLRSELQDAHVRGGLPLHVRNFPSRPIGGHALV